MNKRKKMSKKKGGKVLVNLQRKLIAEKFNSQKKNRMTNSLEEAKINVFRQSVINIVNQVESMQKYFTSNNQAVKEFVAYLKTLLAKLAEGRFQILTLLNYYIENSNHFNSVRDLLRLSLEKIQDNRDKEFFNNCTNFSEKLDTYFSKRVGLDEVSLARLPGVGGSDEHPKQASDTESNGSSVHIAIPANTSESDVSSIEMTMPMNIPHPEARSSCVDGASDERASEPTSLNSHFDGCGESLIRKTRMPS